MARAVNDINPMSEKEELFIEEIDEAKVAMYPFDSRKGGKWMLFYKREYMNAMWQQALSLYRAGELTGIHSLKCSTAAPNPRTNNTTKGVIRFACGPCDDQDLIMSYGENLVKKMKYFSDFGFVPYKTDEQTEKGTRATGATVNFLYRIPVPMKDHLEPDLYRTVGVTPEANQKEITKACRMTARNVHPDKNLGDPTAEEKFKALGAAYKILSDEEKRTRYDRSKSLLDDKRTEIPSRVTTKEWLYEIVDDIALQHYMELNLLGRWLMIYSNEQLDSAWKRACKLYRQNKLTGIAFLKVTTAKRLPEREVKPTGVIACFCGPCHDEELVQKYGRNLVRQMNYVPRYGTIDYKIDLRDEATKSKRLYRIDL